LRCNAILLDHLMGLCTHDYFS